jgi:hypothetical protein
MTSQIQSKFKAHFSSKWGIALPASALLNKEHGIIRRCGWIIEYLFDKNSKGYYLDFYSSHRMTDDCHYRIYENGQTERLEIPLTTYPLSDDPIEAQKSKKEYADYNQHVYKLLKEKGFGWMPSENDEYIIDYCCAIRSAFGEISNSPKDNHLAYLALTSKIEIPIRDKLAHTLYKNLHDKKINVAREWPGKSGRSDIALLDNNNPKAIIEVKAFYTFDLIKKNAADYINEVKKDIDKAKEAANDDTEIYALLLATHPHNVPEHSDAIKYYKSIQNMYKSNENEATHRTNAVNNVSNLQLNNRINASGSITCEKAFGVNVDVLWWLYGPFLKNEN